MSGQIEYFLLTATYDEDFTNKLNSKVKDGWQPIGNVAVAIAKSQYDTTRIYSMLLQRIKTK